jgi:hypothetical protein
MMRALLFGASLLLAACANDDVSNNNFCQDGVVLELDLDPMTPQREYVFQVTTPTLEVACTMTLPVALSLGENVSGTCDMSATITASFAGPATSCLAEGPLTTCVTVQANEVEYRMFVSGIHENIAVAATSEADTITAEIEPTYTSSLEGCQVANTILAL